MRGHPIPIPYQQILMFKFKVFLRQLKRAWHSLPNRHPQTLAYQLGMVLTCPQGYPWTPIQKFFSRMAVLPSRCFSPPSLSSGGLQAQTGPLMTLPLTRCQFLPPLPHPTSATLLTGGPFEALGAWQGACRSPVAQSPAGTWVDAAISWVRELAEGNFLETGGNQGLNSTAGYT